MMARSKYGTSRFRSHDVQLSALEHHAHVSKGISPAASFSFPIIVVIERKENAPPTNINALAALLDY
jgi:hypothetical protein